jgi:peroxiredoxin Q/BCP
VAKLDPGDRAPDFELPGTGGRTYRLSDHRGRWVVIAFYPGDFTPVCTKQFCSYRDRASEIEALDADWLGVSAQSVDSHERFGSRHGLTVPLLADEGKEVARAYGVLAPGGFVRRATFIVDPEGAIRFRDTKLLGMSFAGVDDIAAALAEARAA